MRVLFLVVDSLRADALGCYGSAGRTPTVDALAAGGARFETVVSSAPWTVPSLAAMLSGVFSHRLGLMKWEQPWPRGVPTLFDAFRARGVEVASFVFEPDHLFCACPEAGVAGSSQDTEALLAWFGARPRGDYFAFVHYWWTHVPYLPRRLPLARWNELCAHVLARLSASDPSERLRNRAQIEGLYALAVEELSERWLPRLLEAARADVLVIVADHGESWGERLGPEEALRDVFDLHGNHLHEEVIRVPWILHAPALVRPVVVRGLARTVDVAPTVAALLGLELPPPPPSSPHARAGRSLVPALGSGSIPDGPLAFCSRNRDFVDAPALPREPSEVYVELACRDRRTKLVGRFGGGAPRRYDLLRDPAERAPDALAGRPASAPCARLLRALEGEMEAAVVAPYGPEDHARMQERLRALGYL